ncbi:ABC transporter permease [Mycoplasma mycoides]|uniref:ABC transporter permease n=1 Tax=Mycoplasma mycoides TaxID=2102 RepID=UPI00273684B4|nr:ABC transporter permease [Mycoplasma mycoides]MDP4040026.1 ABC transporter permease [Mycoplasma mycoides]MDP4041010.1 ABC transporter permease [Mycoplasma mycoides]MDP4041787.1 ABC transporter permease [Mycoplasma mycoides]MDP4043435.1 ABC transporter permease [Mycoplasma mycoides]MDP4044302.1 ABC transporter permease [Mycoplasma mycoides]
MPKKVKNSKKLDDSLNLIKYKKIPFRKLIKFCLKNLIKERLFSILNILNILASILIGILLGFLKSGEKQVIIFNFYILFFTCCLLFVLILKMIQFFYNKNLEDKTTYIVLTNQVSRTKFFFSQYFLINLIILINIFLSFCFINLAYSIFNSFKYDSFILKMTLVYFLYNLFASFCLINFISMLMFLFSLQTTTIICTLLVSLCFVANIPLSFVKANEKSYNIQFLDKNNKVEIFKLTDIYDTFTLNENILNSQIKYPYLSKYIYSYFIKNKFLKDQFSNPNNIDLRIKIWKDLGLVNDQKVIIKENNLKLFSKPQENNKILNNWNKNDLFNLQLVLNNTFISNQQLNLLIDKTIDINKKRILIDFKNFSNEINSFFKTDLQISKYDLLYDFLFLDNLKNSNYLIKNNDLKSEKYNLNKDDIKSIYEYELLGFNSDGFKFFNSKNLINKLNFNLMYIARILENYFIRYSSSYIMLSTSSVLKDQSDWSAYFNTRKKMRYFSYLNLYNGLWTFYTSNLGFYYNEIWFSPASDSYINLENQKNLFLGYLEYDLELLNNNIINPNTINNYTKPELYLIILLIINIFSFLIAFLKFKKRDF